MKKQPKIKKTPIKKTKRRLGSTSQAIRLVRATGLVWRHFRLVEHKHTGKLIHYRHTSHLSLVGMLVLVGFFLYASESLAQAQQLTSGGTVLIGAIVPGPAPTVGATITSPISGRGLTAQKVIKVTGKCAPGTFVVVKNNNILVGSTVCTQAGTFMLQIELQLGLNVLSALNYDNLNQPGPETPLISLIVANTAGTQLPTTKPRIPVFLPSNPSIVPGLGSKTLSCNNPKTKVLPIGGVPQVAIVCIPRFVQANTQYTVYATVWGGSPPYALYITWGDTTDSTLLSLATQGTSIIKFSYSQAGTYTITIKLKDKDGKGAIVQTAVQVSGAAETPLAVLAGSVLSTDWFKTPVPLYLTAVAMTLGFWGGDLFDRNFGASKHRHRTRKVA